ncbi:NATT4 protein, partial [Bucco capensis]|nr:NATT4 protein [Bucco capensis]
QLFLTLILLFLVPDAAGAPGPLVGLASRRPLQPPATSWSFPRQKREEEEQETPSYLQWVAFEGKLPTDAVSNWNDYAKRLEFICSTPEHGCSVGAYVPEQGPYCLYPYAGWEQKTQNFKVLVNVGDFEVLGWMADSFGNVPKNSVEGCLSTDVFVGRNSYGVGKISREQRAFFVVVDKEEVWFKWYQVLVVKKGLADVTISHVRYNMSGAVESGEEVTLRKTTVRNEGCQRVKKEVTLEEDTEMDHDWDMDQRIFTTIRGVLQAAPLAFNGTRWEVTNVTDIPWMGGASTSQYVVHNQVVEEEMEPHTTCTVAMEGRRLDLHVPFTALLTRDFGDGQPHHVAITGWSRSRAVVGVRVGVKECWPI